MNSMTLMLFVLHTSLICVGCGTGVYWHEIDVTWSSTGAGRTIASPSLAISEVISKREDVARMQLNHADSNGVIRIEHRSTSGIWIWEQRPAQLHFNLYIPDVSTNGYFYFAFRDGVKGMVPVGVTYEDFDTWHKGNRPLPPLSAQVMPSARGGYHVKMNLAMETFQAGVTGEFVPRQPYRGK